MSVAIGVIIDTSASMTAAGYVADTKIDSSAFVNMALQPNDSFTVVRYDVNGGNVYPPSGTTPAVVDVARTVTKAAEAAINSLTFNGGATNMGSGIQSGRGFIDGATPAKKALVFLTDGYQNFGTDPLTVLPAYPVYTCGMGGIVNTALLQRIATSTGGKYYSVPFISTMMQIYNQIRGTSTTFASVQLLVNSLSPLGAVSYVYLPVAVDDTSDIAEFTVAWDDARYVYTASGQPTGNQISITLVQPNGELSPVTPVVTGSGYAVFDVNTPPVGTWHVQVEYAGSTNINVTVGVFEFAPSSAAITLEVEHLRADDGTSSLRAHVLHNGAKLSGVQVRAETLAPTVSDRDALAANTARLAGIPSTADAPIDDSARLNILRESLLPSHDVLGYRRGLLRFQPQTDDTHLAALVAPRTNLSIVATGVTPGGVPFQRARLVSV